MAVVRRPQIRLYIEGVRLDFRSITISAGVNRPSVCAIDFPPVQELLDLPPRAYVQIFFKDFFNEEGTTQEDFRLIWDGEFRRYRFSKSGTQWSFQIDCDDTTNYWSFAYGLFEPGITEGVDEVFMVGKFAVDPKSGVNILRMGAGVFDEDRIRILTSLRNNRKIEDAVLSYLEESLKLTTFFRIRNRQIKLSPFETDTTGRIVALPDPEVQSLFQADQLTQLVHYAIRNVPSYMDLRTVVSRFLQFFFYQSWPVLSPPIRDITQADGTTAKRLVQMVVKPSTYFGVAPQSNIVWPDEIIRVSHDRDHLTEPTRLRMTTPALGTEITKSILDFALSHSYRAYAPALLGELLKKVVISRVTTPGTELGEPFDVRNAVDPLTPEQIADAVSAVSGKVLDDGLLAEDFEKRQAENSAWAPALVLSDPSLPLESREDIKGVIPAEVPLTHYAWMAAFAQKGKLEAIYISRLAEYYLTLKQHERPTSVTMSWNPYLLVGFPCAVLDHRFPIFGDIASVQHHITSESAITTFNLTYARVDDAVRYVHPDDRDDLGEPDEDLVAKSEKSRTVPKRDVPFWINTAYLPENAGEESYTSKQRTVDSDGVVTGATDVQRVGAYRELFGVGSMFRPLADPAQGSKLVDPQIDLKYSQLETARLLLRIRDVKQDPESRARFEDGFRSRPVASMAEKLDFIDGVFVNEDELGNDESVAATRQPYRAVVQTAVKKIRASMKEQARRAGV